jgi:hypothetical protein
LNDPDKRKAYDRGDSGDGFHGFGGDFDPSSIFKEFFKGGDPFAGFDDLFKDMGGDPFAGFGDPFGDMGGGGGFGGGGFKSVSFSSSSGAGGSFHFEQTITVNGKTIKRSSSSNGGRGGGAGAVQDVQMPDMQMPDMDSLFQDFFNFEF